MAVTATAIPVTTLDHDLELVQRHRYGDASAFEELYRTYEEMVYNLALGLSADRDKAADLSQEIFLRIYRHLAKFRGRSSLKTWVYRVALNHCRSRFRRRPAELLPLGDEVCGLGAAIPASGRDPEQRAMANSEGQRLRRALTLLPKNFRDAVVLRDLGELSYEEIAEILGVRIGTVRSRIARGRLRLRKVLDGGARP